MSLCWPQALSLDATLRALPPADLHPLTGKCCCGQICNAQTHMTPDFCMVMCTHLAGIYSAHKCLLVHFFFFSLNIKDIKVGSGRICLQLCHLLQGAEIWQGTNAFWLGRILFQQSYWMIWDTHLKCTRAKSTLNITFFQTSCNLKH